MESHRQLRIQGTLGITRFDIEERRKSIVVGVSLGNRFFSEVNLNAYLRWAVSHTRDRVIVVIPDRLYAINLRHKDRKSEARAARMAARLGQRMRDIVERTRDGMPLHHAEKVTLAMWDEAVGLSDKYPNNIIALRERFQEDKGSGNTGFYARVMRLVDTFLNNAKRAGTSQERQEALCEYFLQEFAVLVGGLEHESDGLSTLYELLPYPILDDVQRLIVDIQDGSMYPDLRERLIARGRLSFVQLDYDEPAVAA